MTTNPTGGVSAPGPTAGASGTANSTPAKRPGTRAFRPGSRSGGRPYRPGGGRGGRRFGRPKACPLCIEKAKNIDYKDAARLGRFISDRGRMDTRRRSGMCAKHQRMLSQAIKRARHLALLPYTASHIHATGGVGIIERPPRLRMPRREPVAAAPQAAPAPTPTPEKEESAQENIPAKEA
ncbi:MAG: 30S ribosomal protein S18 [Chloroflexota bacterium]